MNMDNENQTQKNDVQTQEILADMQMYNIVKLGKFSYELEEKREQSLINQSNQMLTAFAIFSAALYMALPILIDVNNTLTNKILFCAGIISLFLIASLVLALLAQWRYIYATMNNIKEFHNALKKEPDNYKRQANFDKQWEEQIFSIHTSKKKLNDKRARLITTSMSLFLIAIGAVMVSAITLIFINLGSYDVSYCFNFYYSN